MKYLMTLIIALLLSSCGDELRTRKLSSSTNKDSNALTNNCSMIYKPVCAQPPQADCTPGMVCTAVMPSPQVYNTECLMIEAQATYINDGPCL